MRDTGDSSLGVFWPDTARTGVKVLVSRVKEFVLKVILVVSRVIVSQVNVFVS